MQCVCVWVCESVVVAAASVNCIRGAPTGLSHFVELLNRFPHSYILWNTCATTTTSVTSDQAGVVPHSTKQQQQRTRRCLCNSLCGKCKGAKGNQSWIYPQKIPSSCTATETNNNKNVVNATSTATPAAKETSARERAGEREQERESRKERAGERAANWERPQNESKRIAALSVRLSVCMCVCVRVSACLRVCVCVCCLHCRLLPFWLLLRLSWRFFNNRQSEAATNGDLTAHYAATGK